MKFQTKHVEVEARQVLDDPNNALIADIANWIGSNVVILKDNDEKVYGLRIHGPNNYVGEAYFGDWVIQFSDGHFGVAVAEEFWENWERPEETPKTVETPQDETTEAPTNTRPAYEESEWELRNLRQWAVERVMAEATWESLDAVIDEAKKITNYVRKGGRDEDLHDQEALDTAYLVIAEKVEVPVGTVEDPELIQTAKVEVTEAVIDELTKQGVRFKNGKVLEE